MIAFLRTTVIGGIVFLLPFAVLAIVFEHVLPIVHKVIDPIADRIPVQSIIGLEIPVLATIFTLLMGCFLLGLLARTKLAKGMVRAVELSFLDSIPGYSVLKSMSADFEPSQGQGAHSVVLVQFDDAWQLGLKMEEIASGEMVAVFIPDSPTPQTGSVLIVDAKRVRPTNIPILTAFSCLRGRGAGLGKAIASKRRTE